MAKKLTTGKIRYELAILIQEKQKTCVTDQEKNHAVTLARQEINTKYGIGWRDKYDPRLATMHKQGYDFSKPYQAQDLGDEWSDYAWSADDY